MSIKKTDWLSLGFLITSIVIIIYTFFEIEFAIDVNLHETYFVLMNYHLGIFVGTIILLFSGIYFLFFRIKRPPIRWLGFSHLALVITSFIITIPIRKFVGLRDGPPIRFINHEVKQGLIDWENTDTINRIVKISVILFWIGILFFLVNLLIVLIKKKKQSGI